MKQVNLHCPYCGSFAQLRSAYIVYGTAAITPQQKLYVCGRWPKCDSYVAAHQRTGLPMGTLANGELRHLRILAHQSIRRLQKEWALDDYKAIYKWLESTMGLPPNTVHIAQFSEYRCQQVIRLCEEAIQTSRNTKQQLYKKHSPKVRCDK